MKKRILSLIIALTMIIAMIPTTIVATENDYVYISVSEEDQFVADKNGNAIAYTPVSISALESIDILEYGLDEYAIDWDVDGKQDITALHLFVYVHTTILGLDWANVDPSGGVPGGMYFTSGLFGFEDENLRYNYNGKYPADENGWGYTADNIVLSAGDFIEVGHFSDFNFYMDSAYGFRYFADTNDETQIHFTAEENQPFDFKLNRVSGGMGWEESIVSEPYETIYFGQSVGNEVGTVETDDNGYAQITFPSAGTWYIWSGSGIGADVALESVVTPPASAKITVSGGQEQTQTRQPQDVSAVLNATMAMLASTVKEPAFGTNAGEWTVLSLARGEYFDIDNEYFSDYYDRIVEYVNTKAESINMNGALHKRKSTDNSRLIVALSAIGKDATAVGDWSLVEPYEDFSWIKYQGINGTIWALIALDSNDYQTKDPTIRQQCIDQILSMELDGGGWPLSGGKFDNDITGMAIQALYPYRDQPEVAAAVERAFNHLSEIQLETGGFLYGNAETSESASQVIVACTTWGINPDTDPRFVKKGKSVVDNLLSYYIEEEAMFAHQGNTSNGMATDQACYALVAYNRFINGKTSLYDYSDIRFGEKAEVEIGKPKALLGLPAQITDDIGKNFNATISLDQWDNTAGYKLIDFIVNVPDGLTVKDVTAGNRLSGGEISYHLEEETGKLRVVYFDASEHKELNVNGTAFPATFFTITFEVESANAGSKLAINLGGMSLKKTSDSTDDTSSVIVNTESASASVEVVRGIAYSAVCLYTGDGIDIIPTDKKAVAVSVVGVEKANKLLYNDGTNEYEFSYNKDISQKTGVITYVALVDASIDMTNFTKKTNFTLKSGEADSLTFGDSNGDGVINAQDALAAVDVWLRKTEEIDNKSILALNVNGDSRINTYDALGIVEFFVDNSEYLIVTKAARLSAKN